MPPPPPPPLAGEPAAPLEVPCVYASPLASQKALVPSPATSTSTMGSPAPFAKTRSANDVLSPRVRGPLGPYAGYSPRKRLSADFSDGTFSGDSGVDSPKSERGGWRIHSIVAGPFLTGPLAKDFAARLEDLRSPRGKKELTDFDDAGLLLFPVVPDFVPPAITPEVFQASIQPQPEPDHSLTPPPSEADMTPEVPQETPVSNQTADAQPEANAQHEQFYQEQYTEQYSAEQQYAEQYSAEQQYDEQYPGAQQFAEQYAEQYTAGQQASYDYYSTGYDQYYNSTEAYNYQEQYDHTQYPPASGEEISDQAYSPEETYQALPPPPPTDEAFPPLPSVAAHSIEPVAEIPAIEMAEVKQSSPTGRERAPSYADIVTGVAHSPRAPFPKALDSPEKSAQDSFDKLAEGIAESMNDILDKSKGGKTHAEVEFRCMIHKIQTQLKVMGKVSNNLRLEQLKTLQKLKQTEIEKMTAESSNAEMSHLIKQYQLEREQLKEQLTKALDAKDTRLNEVVQELNEKIESLKCSTNSSSSRLASEIEAIRKCASPDDLEKRVEEISEVLDDLIENQQAANAKDTKGQSKPLRRSSKSATRRQSFGSWKSVALYGIVVWAASLCGVYVGVKYAGVQEPTAISYQPLSLQEADLDMILSRLAEKLPVASHPAMPSLAEEVFSEVVQTVDLETSQEDNASKPPVDLIQEESPVEIIEYVVPAIEGDRFNSAPILEDVPPQNVEETRAKSSPTDIVEVAVQHEVAVSSMENAPLEIAEEVTEVETVESEVENVVETVQSEVEAVQLEAEIADAEVVHVTTHGEAGLAHTETEIADAEPEVVDAETELSDAATAIAETNIKENAAVGDHDVDDIDRTESCFTCAEGYSTLASHFCEVVTEVPTVAATLEAVEEITAGIAETVVDAVVSSEVNTIEVDLFESSEVSITWNDVASSFGISETDGVVHDAIEVPSIEVDEEEPLQDAQEESIYEAVEPLTAAPPVDEVVDNVNVVDELVVIDEFVDEAIAEPTDYDVSADSPDGLTEPVKQYVSAVCKPFAYALYVWCPSVFDMPAQPKPVSSPLSGLARALTSLSTQILDHATSESTAELEDVELVEALIETREDGATPSEPSEVEVEILEDVEAHVDVVTDSELPEVHFEVHEDVAADSESSEVEVDTPQDINDSEPFEVEADTSDEAEVFYPEGTSDEAGDASGSVIESDAEAVTTEVDHAIEESPSDVASDATVAEPDDVTPTWNHVFELASTTPTAPAIEDARTSDLEATNVETPVDVSPLWHHVLELSTPVAPSAEMIVETVAAYAEETVGIRSHWVTEQFLIGAGVMCGSSFAELVAVETARAVEAVAEVAEEMQSLEWALPTSEVEFSYSNVSEVIAHVEVTEEPISSTVETEVIESPLAQEADAPVSTVDDSAASCSLDRCPLLTISDELVSKVANVSLTPVAPASVIEEASSSDDLPGKCSASEFDFKARVLSGL